MKPEPRSGLSLARLDCPSLNRHDGVDVPDLRLQSSNELLPNPFGYELPSSFGGEDQRPKPVARLTTHQSRVSSNPCSPSGTFRPSGSPQKFDSTQEACLTIRPISAYSPTALSFYRSPPDHRSRFATFRSARWSLQPLGTILMMRLNEFRVKKKVSFCAHYPHTLSGV